jgi:hypothetical protein
MPISIGSRHPAICVGNQLFSLDMRSNSHALFVIEDQLGNHSTLLKFTVSASVVIALGASISKMFRRNCTPEPE